MNLLKLIFSLYRCCELSRLYEAKESNTFIPNEKGIHARFIENGKRGLLEALLASN